MCFAQPRLSRQRNAAGKYIEVRSCFLAGQRDRRDELSQVIEYCGGADETRTRDLLRDRQAF